MRVPSLVEMRFIIENGLDDRTFLGDVFNRHYRDAYAINGREFSDSLVLGQLTAVEIVRARRFGNAVQQLLTAFAFCRRNQVPMVRHPGFDWFSDDIEIAGVRIVANASPTARELAGMFCHKYTLGPLSGPEERYELLQQLAGGLTLDRSLPPADPDELFIHLRSGDIFRDQGAHRAYGQPPLAFYRKVLAMQPWRRVMLVYEDEGNPCIGPLKQLLLDAGVAFSVCSGTLREDLQTLYRAQNLVIGRGTFIYPILCTSLNIRTVFAFEDTHAPRWGLKGPTVRQFRDRGGSYAPVLSRWGNKPRQRQLMLDYPEGEIEEVTEAGAPRRARVHVSSEVAAKVP